MVADGRPGGGTVMVAALLQALRRAGAEPALVVDAGSHAAEAARREGIEVAEIPFFSFFTASAELRRQLDRLRPDVVHVHGSRAAFHVAPWSRRHASVPVHYTVHGYHFHHRLWARRVAGRWAERRATRGLRTVVHVCDYDRRLAERWRLIGGSAARRVVYNGVDVEALPPAAPAEPPRVAFVGRLVPQKDPDLIAAVAGRLAAAGAAVTIVGGGPGEAGVRRALAPEVAAGGVVMTGAVDRARALRELAGASVLVLPSRWEGLPVVLLEALGAGIPAVAAAVGGVPEIVSHGRTGLLVESRDPGDFAAAASRLLADADERRRLGAAGRELVRERFALADCVARYLELYG